MILQDGSELGNYTIIKKLGGGGMADVYLAYDNQLERKVALKVLPPEFARDATRLARFEKEIKATAKLHHPGLVPVFEVNQAILDGLTIHYYSMSYLPGGELTERIKEGLTVEESINIIVALAEALGYAHANGIVHRDIKPQNVLFDSFNKPVISDLGIARSTNLDETRVTSTGLGIGTPFYMSPEQALGETQIDGRTDIYALGVLFYEMLIGQVPFDGNSGMAVAIKHIQEKIPALPQTHAKFQPIINKCLAKHKEDRYLKTQDFINDLLNVSHHHQQKHAVYSSKQFKLLATFASALIVAIAGILIYQNIEPKNNHLPILAQPPSPPSLTVSNTNVAYEKNDTDEISQELEVVAEQADFTSEQQESFKDQVDIQALIRDLVARAEQDIRDLKLTLPQGESAIDKIKQIKELDSENEQIHYLNDLLVQKYVQLINSDLDGNQFISARERLVIAKSIADAHPLLKGLGNKINAMELKQKQQKALMFAGEMVDLAGGEFLMGSSSSQIKSELPQSKVTIKAFKIGKTEVTVSQFESFIEDTGYKTFAEEKDQGCYIYSKTWQELKQHSWRSPGYIQSKNHPVVCVSFYDVQAFIKWLNEETGLKFRLPSESEWEYASRAGGSSQFSFGDSVGSLCQYGNFADTDDIENEQSGKLSFDFLNAKKDRCQDGFIAGTAPVSSYKENAFGLVDMHGNVAEWVEDCWQRNLQNLHNNGAPRLNGGCEYRVIRGGSWFDEATHVRSASRDKNAKLNRDNTTGFRLALDL